MDRFSIVEGHYYWNRDHHSGQYSEEYRRMCRIQRHYKPTLRADGPEDGAREVYDALCNKRGCCSSLSDLSEAIERDHPCSDTVGCDIACALESGDVLWAAHVLCNATEAPNATRVLERVIAKLGDRYQAELDASRDSFIEGNPSWCCGACGAYNYEALGDGAESCCRNCSAKVRMPEAEREAAEE